MKKLRLLLSVMTCLLLHCCSGSSQSVNEYTFHDLRIPYPSSCEITKLVEQNSLTSFILVDTQTPDSQIEFGISMFDKDFLSHVPREEMMGELVASVFDMKEKVLSTEGVIPEKVGDIEVSARGQRPEAYAFATVNEKGTRVYFILSSMIVGNYNITTASRTPDPSTMELFTGITDNIFIQ